MSDQQDATPTLAPGSDATPTLPPDAPPPVPCGDRPGKRGEAGRTDDLRTLPPSVTQLPAGAVVQGPGVAPAGVNTWMTHQPTPRPAPAAAAKAPAPPPDGARMIGEFELLEPLGKGGMGVVYRAKQWTLQREVALKVLDPSFATSAEAVERFAREARAAAAVNHPNVITIIAAGRDAASGRLYMVMELVRGGDAEQLAQREGGKLPVRRALEVVRDAARGLGAVERAGLVHRDIKPSNLFVTEDGVAKLADLGLARSRAGGDRVTQTGLVVGTPAFMPPEQAMGELDLDIRVDVYALGATLFRLLTGRAPYEGGSMMSVLTAVVRDPVPDPRTVEPTVPPAVATLVMRAMAKDRRERFASAAELLAALQAALDELEAPGAPTARLAPSAARVRLAPPPRSASIVDDEPAPEPEDDEALDPDDDEDDDERGPPMAPVIAAGVAMAVVLLGGGWLLLRPRASDRPPLLASTERAPAPATEPPPRTVAEAPRATEAPPPPITERAPPPVTEDAPPVTPVTETATSEPPPPATEPPPPATEPPPPPRTTEPPPRATEPPPPRPWIAPRLVVGGAARRCRAYRENAFELRPDGWADLVTLHAEVGHDAPLRAVWDVSRLAIVQRARKPPSEGDLRRPPPGVSRPRPLSGLLWGDEPEGFVLMTGLSWVGRPIDERGHLADGALAAVFFVDSAGHVRAGVVCVEPGDALKRGAGDPLDAAVVVARGDLALGPDGDARVVLSADAQGWRVDVRVGDQVALSAERPWGRRGAPGKLSPWADASNSGWEGTCAVSVQVQAGD